MIIFSYDLPYNTDNVPTCFQCGDELKLQDVLIILFPDDGSKADHQHLVCVNEDCPEWNKIQTMFNDLDKPLYQGCFTKAYPEQIDEDRPWRKPNDPQTS